MHHTAHSYKHKREINSSIIKGYHVFKSLPSALCVSHSAQDVNKIVATVHAGVVAKTSLLISAEAEATAGAQSTCALQHALKMLYE